MTDFETRVVIGGEVVDLIDSVKSAADIIEQTVAECTARLQQS